MNAQEIFGKARWLTPGDTTKVVYIRGEFKLTKPVASAELYVCGLGFYEFIESLSKGATYPVC